MTRSEIENYTDVELLEGKTKQEIFSTLLAETTLKTHILAEVIRKVPTPEKRTRYKTLNSCLVVLLLIIAFFKLFFLGSLLMRESDLALLLITLTVPALLLATFFYAVHGVSKFKRNAHLMTGFLVTLNLILAIPFFISSMNGLLLADIVAGIPAIVLAFLLDARLSGDYRLLKQEVAGEASGEVQVEFTE